MEGPVSWGPSVPVHLPSMDATVNVTYEKSKLLGGTGLGGGEERESEEFTAGVLSLSQALWVCPPRHLAAQEVFPVQVLARPAPLFSSGLSTWLW